MMAIKGHIPVFYNGEYHTFYPKTLLSQVISSDGKTLETLLDVINTGSITSDPNSITSNGIYNISNSVIMPTTGKYIIDVSVYDENNIYQTAISVDTGEKFIRWKKDGVWEEWKEFTAGVNNITFYKEEVKVTYQQSWGRTIPIPKDGFDPNINKFIIIIGSVVIVSRRYTVEGTNVILNEDEDLLEDGRTIDFIFFTVGNNGENVSVYSNNYSSNANILLMGNNGENVSVYSNNYSSNANILLNGDFQIWQRGSSFNNIETNKYCADRWLHIKDVTESVMNITKTDNGIHLNSSTSENIHHLVQLLPDDFTNKHINDMFTVSIKVSNFENTTSLSLNGEEFINNGVQTNGSNGIYTRTLNLSKYPSKENLYVSIDGTHIDAYIEWVKLEFGENCTKFISRSYDDELNDCMRYFETIDYCEYDRPYVVFSKNSTFISNIDFKVIKKNIPVLVINDNNTASQYSDDINIVNITSKHVDKYGAIITIDKNLDAISLKKYTADAEIYL